MTLAEKNWLSIGFHVQRIAGTNGFGDHLSIRSNWGYDNDFEKLKTAVIPFMFQVVAFR